MQNIKFCYLIALMLFGVATSWNTAPTQADVTFDPPMTITSPSVIAVSHITIDIEANSIAPETETQILVTVFRSDNQPMVGVPVTLFAGWGTISPTSGISNQDGQIQAIFTAGKQPGQAKVTALVSSVSQSATIQILDETNHPPLPPNAPEPADGAANLPLPDKLFLRWQASDPDDDLTAYTVSFGDAYPPSIIANRVVNNEFTIDRDLAPVTYYWSITVTDGIDERSSPVWSFSLTSSNPTPKSTIYLPVIVKP